MNREWAIFFVRVGKKLPETYPGVWAESAEQARADFLEVMAAIRNWYPEKIMITSVREITNPRCCQYLTMEQAAFHLQCQVSSIRRLVAAGYLPPRPRGGQWLCSWEELDRARRREKLASHLIWNQKGSLGVNGSSDRAAGTCADAGSARETSVTSLHTNNFAGKPQETPNQ